MSDRSSSEPATPPCPACGGRLVAWRTEALRCGNCGLRRRDGPSAGPPGDPAAVEDPVAWAAALAARTPPGGTATVETADAGHPLGGGVPRSGLRWGFTAAALTWLLERHGLRVVSRRLRLRPALRVVVRRTPPPA